MIWKAVTLLGAAACVLGDGRHHAYSEQMVVVNNHEHRGHHGELAHIGNHKPEHHQEYAWTYPSYEFSYKVMDPHTHDFKGQHESRDGDVVKGWYWLVQPDGLKRVVKYHADKHSGFKAQVHYEGHQHHPHVVHYPKQQEPIVEERNPIEIRNPEVELREAEEENRQREEENRKREEENRQREEEKRQREEENRQREEENRQREEENREREEENREREEYNREPEMDYRMPKAHMHKMHKPKEHKPVLQHLVPVFGERERENQERKPMIEKHKPIPVFDFERIQPKIEHKKHKEEKKERQEEEIHIKPFSYHREIYHPHVHKEERAERKPMQMQMERMPMRNEEAEQEREENNEERGGRQHNHRVHEPYYGHKRYYKH